MPDYYRSVSHLSHQAKNIPLSDAISWARREWLKCSSVILLEERISEPTLRMEMLWIFEIGWVLKHWVWCYCNGRLWESTISNELGVL
jgi:hypothetical protein